jgi:hypothetical protein
MLCLLYYAYVFSSTKLEIRAEQVLPFGSKCVAFFVNYAENCLK